MITINGALGHLAVAVTAFAVSVSVLHAQNAPQFTTVKATDEKAIQLRWRSDSNVVYRIECTADLSGSIVWETLVDLFPAQGTNTILLDTGNYWTEPALAHPKDSPQRFYRLLQVGTNTLTPPIVTITNLSAGINVFGEVEIDVHVSTADSVASVSFFVDGEEVEMATADDNGNASYVINTTEWSNGVHEIFAVAQTASGSAATGELESNEESGAGTSAAIPVTFDNLISKWYFSLPGFDASLGQTQHITAEFISYCDWTLEIVDQFSTTVKNASGSGTSMAFDWDGTDNLGSPTADGTFDFILTATRTSAPIQLQSASLATGERTRLPTEILVASANGLGAVVPLAIYPPGMDTNGLTIFEGSLSDYFPQRTASESETSLLSVGSGSGSPEPLYAGASQSTQRPHRPPPKPIKGTPGKLGVAWQGHHPNPGTNGIAGFNPPPNLVGSIQLVPNYLLPYGPIKRASAIASGFEGTMKKYKWTTAFNYGDDKLTAALLRKPSKGGSNLFNYCNIGLLIGHGIRGGNQDARATSTPSLQTYLPIYKTGVNAYDWVRLSEFDFGGGPVGLRWMGVYACNVLFPHNAQDMYNKGVLPMNQNLHVLCGESTSIYMYPSFGQKWASYMNGAEAGGVQTVINAWILASQRIHALVNPGAGHPVSMSCAYWPDCVNDTLQGYTDNGSTDPSDISFRTVQVYP